MASQVAPRVGLKAGSPVVLAAMVAVLTVELKVEGAPVAREVEVVNAALAMAVVVTLVVAAEAKAMAAYMVLAGVEKAAAHVLLQAAWQAQASDSTRSQTGSTRLRRPCQSRMDLDGCTPRSHRPGASVVGRMLDMMKQAFHGG